MRESEVWGLSMGTGARREKAGAAADATVPAPSRPALHYRAGHARAPPAILDPMPHRDDDPLRASDRRFQRRRAELVDEIRALLGHRGAAAPVDDANRAAALAAESEAGHRAAREHGWAVVHHDWPAAARGAVAALVQAVSARIGARGVWLVLPGRDPQAVPLDAEAVLDNPFGFARLAGEELVLLDRELPAGLWLAGPGAGADGWRLEVWGTEPWLSAATRALREQRGADESPDDSGG